LPFFLSQFFSNGQDTLRRYEFGSTLFSINSFRSEYYFAPDRPKIEFVNGLFFRYAIKRFGFRLQTSYSDNTTSFATPDTWADGFSGDINNKDFRLGIGGQYSLLGTSQFLYVLLDLYYRHVISTGHDYGGISGANNKFSSTANGVDFFAGLGFKFRTFRNMYLSPEAGFYYTSKLVNKATTSMSRGNSSSFDFTDSALNFFVKLHLTVKF
jgi:hypothetical protein